MKFLATLLFLIPFTVLADDAVVEKPVDVKVEQTAEVKPEAAKEEVKKDEAVKPAEKKEEAKPAGKPGKKKHRKYEGRKVPV